MGNVKPIRHGKMWEDVGRYEQGMRKCGNCEKIHELNGSF